MDLAFRGSGGRATLAAIGPWIEREVSYEEAEAALDLATALAAADGKLFAASPKVSAPTSASKSAGKSAVESGTERPPARLLLDHFLAGVVDPDYALALKSRLLERPLSDKPQAVAKAELLAKTLTPRQGESLFARLGFLLRRLVTVRSAGRRK